MKNLSRVVLLILLLFSNVFNLEAQIYGYGSTFISDPTPGYSFVLNSSRAKVISFNFSSPPYTVDFINELGYIGPGDMILMAQVKGTNEGIHQNLEVISRAGNTLTVNFVPGATSFNSFTLGSNDQIQIVRIPIYDYFYLTPDIIVSCAPYNPTVGHGGIMAMIVKGNLIIDGGLIQADGAGYETEGITWGNGGPPALNVTSNDHLGCEGESFGKMFDGTDCNPIMLSSYGENGGSPNNNGSAGAKSTGTRILHSSSHPLKIVMGNGGGYRSGTGGGTGSGSGGPGGKGGDVSSFGLGQPGIPGGSGNPGGDAGHGQPGGGAILIKCGNLNVSPTILNNKVISFSANGADGGFGRHGGNGGIGGTHGSGGTGGCTGGNPIPDGGDGGDGLWGSSGEGGDGGNGGDAGFIWISLNNSSSTLTYSQISSIVELLGGSRGLPGVQGYTEIQSSLLARYDRKIPNYCQNNVLCPTPPCNPTTELNCDLEKVMCALHSAISGRSGTANNDVIFVDASGTDILEYRASDGRLITLVPNLINCINYYYFVYLNTAGGFGNATKFMNYLGTLEPQPTTKLYVDLAQTTANSVCSNGLNFYLSNYQLGFVIDPISNYIIDKNSSKVAQILPCPGKIKHGSAKLSYIPYMYSKLGDPGIDGYKTIGPSSNLQFDVPGLYKTNPNKAETGVNISTEIYNNSDNSEVYLSTESESFQIIKFKIYEISGRLIENGDIELVAGLNKIKIPLNISNSGIYLLEVDYSNGQKIVHKIVY